MRDFDTIVREKRGDSEIAAANVPVAYAVDRRARPNPLNVRHDYPKYKSLQRELTARYEEVHASPAARRMSARRRKEYAARVAWSIVKKSGRYRDYFQQGSKMSKTRRSAKQVAATKRMIAARKRSLRGGSKKTRSSGRKKHRSAAQIAATKKMIRAARRANKKGGHKAKRKNARRATTKSGHRKSAKRVAAGKKAARTRKRNLAKRHGAPKMSAHDGNLINKRGKRVKQPRRKTGGRNVAGTFKKSRTKARKAYLRKHPWNNRPSKREAPLSLKKAKAAKKSKKRKTAKKKTSKKVGGKKAAKTKGRQGAQRVKAKKTTKRLKRTGASKHAPGKFGMRKKTHKALPKLDRSGDRHNEYVQKPEVVSKTAHRAMQKAAKGEALTEGEEKALATAARHGAPAMAARENPISVGGVIGASLIGGFGAFSAEMADRWMATHALTAQATPNAPTGVENGTVDIPPSGGLTNNLAPALPMDWKRWAVGAGMTFGPFVLSGISYKLKAPTPVQTALSSMGIGAGVRTGMRGLMDLASMLLKGKSIGERLFQAEYIAKQQVADGGTLKQINLPYQLVATGAAGTPGILGRIFGKKTNAVRPAVGASGCCAECSQGRPCVKNPPAPPTEGDVNAADQAGVAGAPKQLPEHTRQPMAAKVLNLHPEYND